jgi:hypothetical protein
MRFADSIIAVFLLLTSLTSTAQEIPTLRRDLLITELRNVQLEVEKLNSYCKKYVDHLLCMGGNSNHEYEKFQCYSVGLGLGFVNHVNHLRPRHTLNLNIPNRDTALDAGIEADILSKLAISLNNVIDKKLGDLAQVWNLDCVGKYKIPKGHISIYGNFFSFDKKTGVLRIIGDVDESFAKKLESAIRASPGVKIVGLSSGGGSVEQAIMAGRLLRRLGLTTQLEGSCYSACPLVFAGGVERISYAPHPVLGFHQVSINGLAVSETHVVYDRIINYLKEMRIRPHLFYKLMLSALPSGMTNIKADEEFLCRDNIVTWSQRGCSSEKFGW